MILRTIEEVLNSKNNVEADNWASRRFLVKETLKTTNELKLKMI